MTQNVKTQNVEFNYSVSTKVARAIAEKAKNLSQVIKQFSGIMGETVTIEVRQRTYTYTISEFMKAHGVELNRGKLTVPAIIKAWSIKDEEGKLAVVKNIPAMTMTNEQTPDEKRIYQWATTEEGGKWTPVTVKGKVAVADGKWSVDTVLRGLIQSKYAEKFDKQIAKSLEAWSEVEKVYYFESRQNKDGEENKAHEYAKDMVVFKK